MMVQNAMPRPACPVLATIRECLVNAATAADALEAALEAVKATERPTNQKDLLHRATTIESLVIRRARVTHQRDFCARLVELCEGRGAGDRTRRCSLTGTDCTADEKTCGGWCGGMD